MATNRELLSILRDRQEDHSSAFKDTQVQTSGNAVYDFLGQALWGVVDQGTLGTLDVADTYNEAVYGDDVTTWEESLAGDAAGDWGELTNSGKAGYMIGSALGMIPSFVFGGLAARAGIQGAGRLATGAGKHFAKKSLEELTEAGTKIAAKEGLESVTEVLGKKVTREGVEATVGKHIVDDAYEIASASATAGAIEKALGAEMLEQVMGKSVKNTLSDVAGIVDDDILEALSKETVKIVSKNNPEDAMQMMNYFVTKIPVLGKRLGPKANLFVGAMGYDAAIGVAMATLHTAVDATHKGLWGVGWDDETGEHTMSPTGRALDPYHIASKWAHDAMHEAAFFSLLGPVKFVKGGTNANHMSRLNRIFQQGYKSLKPIKNMKRKELKAQLTAMNKISGGNLEGRLSSKWSQKPAEWWNTIKKGDKAGTAEMQEFLSEMRKKFLVNAPKEWVKEFGSDVFKSLPRMGAGVMAMNSTGLAQSFWENGLSYESLKYAMGGSPQERIANIMTAMYFTRTPHSFHTPVSSGGFKTVFQTGNVESYIGGKASKLRRLMGGLETFGVDKNQLKAISYIYGDPKTSTDAGKVADNVIKRAMDSTTEFAELENIFKPFVANEAIDGVDLKTAFHKHVSDLVSAKDITTAEAKILNDKLFVAEKIISEYDTNRLTDFLGVSKYTPEQAFEIVSNVSKMEFAGKILTPSTADPQMRIWRKKAYIKAAEEPIQYFQKFITDMYESLGLKSFYKIDPDTGVIQGPRLNKKQFDTGDRSVNQAFATVYDWGVKNNWIREIEGKLPPGIDGEMAANAKSSYDSAVNNLMGLTYGPEWSKTMEVDPRILENNAWHLPYDTVIKMQQRDRTYEFLSRGKDHGMRAGEASDLINKMERMLLYREVPELLKPESLPENFGEVAKFVEDMHSVLRSLNAGSVPNQKKTVTFEEASAVMEKMRENFGDVFTDSKTLRDLKRDILDRSIDALGIDDVQVGFDTKAGLVTILKDINLNYQAEGKTAILPSMKDMDSNLTMLLKNNKIGKDTYVELRNYYEKLTNAIERSKFPTSLQDGLVETDKGAWMRSLLKSKATAETAWDGITIDRVTTQGELVYHEAEKLGRMANDLSKGLGEVDAKLRKKHDEITIAMNGERKALLELGDFIKTALEERNVYKLRALGKKEGSINDVINALSKNMVGSTRIDYLTKITETTVDIMNKAQTLALNESTIKDFVDTQLSPYRDVIGTKDVQDNALRISTNQFSTKYQIPKLELDNLFDVDRSIRKNADEVRNIGRNILGDVYSDPSLISNPQLRQQVQTMINTLNGLAGKIELNSKNYHNLIAEPLRLKMEVSNSAGDLKLSKSEIDADWYAINAGYFSKQVVSTVKVDLQNNRLILGSKVVGETKDRGLTGLLAKLDPNQKYLYLVETSGFDGDGRVMRNILNVDLDKTNAALRTGDFSLYNAEGKREFYNQGTASKLKGNAKDKPLMKQDFHIVQINEGTAIAIRTDAFNRSIHKEIAAQFGPQGELFKRLEAVYDGDLGGSTAQKNAVSQLLSRIREAQTPEAIAEAVKLTRMLLNMSGEIPGVIENGEVRLNHENIIDLHKRDKLNETKNGFIPTEGNREKANLILKNSQSDLFKKVHSEVESWLIPDAKGNYRKVKTTSINDEPIMDRGETRKNIFDALSREEIRLKKMEKNKEISLEDLEYNINRIKETTKSIVDGSTFVTKEFYLANLALYGINPEMLVVDNAGNIQGFKSGAIKPTITHNKLNWENKQDANYGRIEQFFNKTSIQYDPLLETLLGDLGVDMLTFKSANKLNKIKKSKNEELKDNYTEIDLASRDIDLESAWYDYIPNRMSKQTITELPFESFSLRNVSKEHDPLVGQNAGVHMSTDNGIAGWINMRGKIDRYEQNLAYTHKDPFHRTALAQQILGTLSAEGNPSMIGSSLNSIVTRNGLILEPWAQQRLQDNMINFFVNNGRIGSGEVTHGSLDVMRADWGTLKGSVRSKIGDKPVVQYFGEFVPSYYAANKTFSLKPDGNNVHNVLIQKIKYNAETGSRDADAFFVSIGGQKFLQVEGRYINEKGQLVDADFNNKVISADNKKAYKDALEREQSAIDELTKNRFLGDFTKIWEAASRFDKYGLSIGMLNSRQPRNMMGDMVISKLAKYDGKWHMDENAGNVSMMNARDAIKPQDADFDFDKSFNYTSAPGEFWRETNKLAGHVTDAIESPLTTIDRFFDPNVREGAFAQALPGLIGKDIGNFSAIQKEVDAARGRFIKMHQVATYLSNIYKNDPLVMSFSTKRMYQNQSNFQVRLNRNGKYVNMVDTISKLAIEYIDIYKNLPSFKNVKEFENKLAEIYFGKNGIFEIGYQEKGKEFKVAEDMNVAQFEHVKNAIMSRLIHPLNKYLRYNKGVEVSEAGQENSARLQDYHNAFSNLVSKSLDPSKRWGIDERIEFDGLNQARKFFQNPNNPYDIGMQKMHEIYKQQNNIKEAGQYGRGKSEVEQLQEYIDNGLSAIPGNTTEAKHNNMFNSALKHYVKDEARALRLVDLSAKEKSLQIEIETKKNFTRNDMDTLEITSLQNKLMRVQEMKAMMEEALSYKFASKDPGNPPETIFHKGHRIETYRAEDKPVVVIDMKGSIKEVILPGQFNRQPILSRDKMVVNGRRYQVTDGVEQGGLRALFEAFAGTPSIRLEDGNVRRFSSYETKNYLMSEYKLLQSELIKLRESSDLTNRQGQTDYSMERQAIFFDFLFGKTEDIAFRKALILRMLTPEVSDKIVSIRSNNVMNSKQAVFDYMYLENRMSEPVMSLLSQLASGEYKPNSGLKMQAEEILNDINLMKNAAYISSRNPNINMEQLKSNMFTEPGSLEGYLTTERYLNQEIFEARDISTGNEREAAKVMIEHASGTLVDPIVLYKASKVMEAKGIEVEKQWGIEQYATNPDGTVRNFGAKKVLISESESIRRKNVGDRGSVRESAVDRTRELLNCYK